MTISVLLAIIYSVVCFVGFCVLYLFSKKRHRERQERERQEDKEIKEMEKREYLLIMNLERDTIEYLQILAGSPSVEKFVRSALNFYGNVVIWRSEGNSVFVGKSRQDAALLTFEGLEKVISSKDSRKV